jgi:carboxyl-terminal processing protease
LNKLFSRIISGILVLSLAAAPVFALDGAEAAKRLRAAALVINREGLIAETAPITRAEIDEACALLEESPERIYELVNGFLARMDSHSGYYAPISYGDNYAMLTGYAGIGVVIEETENGFVVEDVTAHSPARKAGILPGDRLHMVDGKAVDQLTLDALSELLRGDAGTKVTVTVLRDGEKLRFELVRAVIRDSEVTSKELARDLHYISIAGFASQHTPSDFAEALEAVDSGDDLILDLRGNGGGVLDYALTAADALLTERVLMCTMRMRADKGGREEVFSDGGGLVLNDLMVLVDDRTASAAELLAGILQEAGGAMLIGETTYGKGQGQYHMNMTSGDKLVLTALAMELPKTGCWEGRGLTPDVAVSLMRMADAAAVCSPLDTETPIRYGEQSRAVRAMTERLKYLGYLACPTDTFNTPVLSALRAFQEDAGIDTTIGAYPETLRALTKMMERAVNGNYFTDCQLTAAMAAALCEH